MAVPVARVHLKVAHAALPALLPTPPRWKTLPRLPSPSVAAVLPKPLTKPGRADADERWDARKTKTSSSPRKNVTSPPPKPKPGRADSVERWDAHKKAAIPAASSSSSSLSSGTSSLVSRSCKISRTSSRERWDVQKKRCPPQAAMLEDGDEIDTEEEIVWKPQAMYAGPGFVAAAPEPSMLPVPTGFLVRVA